MPEGPRGLEAARIALLGPALPEILNAAAVAGAGFLFYRAFEAQQALDLVLEAVAALDRTGTIPDPRLLRVGADCAHRLGSTNVEDRLLERGLQIANTDPRARAMLLVASALRLQRGGEIDRAEQLLNEATATFASLGDVRQRAAAMSNIADILRARGQFDDAINICREDLLPAFERLGDVRARHNDGQNCRHPAGPRPVRRGP
ncbi:MAG: hypothetical protein ACREE9_21655 [Stellaceae bacterium]